MKGIFLRNKSNLRFLKPIWGSYREWLGRFPLHKLPISSRYFGRPKGYYETTLEYIRKYPSGNEAIEVFPEETIKRLPPLTVGNKVHWKFLSNLEAKIPSTFAYSLKNMRFWGFYGGSIITEDDKVLADLSPDVWGIKKHKIFTKFKLPNCKRLPGTVAVISTPEADTNYWHWTFDLLTRIHILNKAGFTPNKIDYYLVNHRGKHFQLETLQKLGIDKEKIIQTDPSYHVEIEQLVTTSFKQSQYHVPKWTCEFLYELVKPNYKKETLPKRVYISRANCSFRRLKNEEEVLNILKPLGFEVILPDELEVSKQRALFNNADVIVAPHGSALTNLVYCRPKTIAIEIFSPHYVDIAFWCHGSLSLLNYFVIIGEGEQLPEGLDPVRRQDNIYVSISKLKIALKELNVV